MNAPPGIAWSQSVTRFLTALVERDIGYLDVEIAVEAMVHAGLHGEITVPFELDGRTVYWHRMPPKMPGLQPLDIFTTIAQSGLIEVFYVRFAVEGGKL